MKHRSVGTFIVLAALLLAVPQASNDLLSLAGDAGAHARSELLRAFLGLQSGGTVTVIAGETSSPRTASCSSQAAEVARGSRKTVQTPARVPASVTPRVETPDAGSLELAMILDPAFEGQTAQPSADFVRRIEASEFMQLPAPAAKEFKPLGELAMIIPPSASIPPVAAAVRNEGSKIKAARAAQEDAGQHQVFVAARLAGKGVRVNAEEIRREVCAAAGKEAGAAAGGSKGKASAGVSRTQDEVKALVESAACGAPLFVKVATLAPPVPSPAPAYYFTASE